VALTTSDFEAALARLEQHGGRCHVNCQQAHFRPIWSPDGLKQQCWPQLSIPPWR
jgi:hypothetical protein